MTDWLEFKLQDLLSRPIQNGYSPNCPDEPNGRWILGLGTLTENGLDVSQAKPAPLDDEAVGNFLLESGDFLVSRSNTLEKVGRSALYRGELSCCSYPDLMMRFRVDGSRVWLDFLEQYLRSRRVQRHFQRCASGTSETMVKITKSTVENLTILLPPLPEQKAIADTLSTWDAAIEKTERLIAAKELLVVATIQRIIDSKTSTWIHKRVDEVFEEVSDKNCPDEELLSVTQTRGVIPRSMLEGRVMSPEGTLDTYKRIQRGDFVISLRSFQGGLEYSEYTGILSPAYTVLRPKIAIETEFYRHFFKTYLFVEKYLAISVIGIRDGKQISIPDFMISKIPLPSVGEQKEIASMLNLMRKEIDAHRSILEKLKLQKRGLMQKLLTGAWRVPVRNKVVT